MSQHFYVSSLVTRNGKQLVGITDTSDDKEEFYSIEDVHSIVKQGIEILGVTEYAIELFGKNAVSLIDLPVGTPLKIKLSKSSPFKQVILLETSVGRSDKNTTFYFFDNEGVDGYFGLTAPFVSTRVQISLNDNDPIKVAQLLKAVNERRK